MFNSDESLLLKIHNSPSLCAGTKVLYLSKIKRVQESIMVGKSLDLILSNPKLFVRNLLKFGESEKGRGLGSVGLSAHSLESYMASLMSLFHHNQDYRESHYELYKVWKSELELIKLPIKEKYLGNKPTAKQEKALVSFERICEVRDGLAKGSLERLLLCMYTMIPPVRSDYAFLCIYRRRVLSKAVSDSNYLLIYSKIRMEVVLNSYKTSAKYKEIRIKLPLELCEEILLSLEKQPRDYLFVSKRGGCPYGDLKYGERAYNAWANYLLKRLFGDRFSLTMFRHIYISRPDLALHLKTGLEQDELARLMGHSADIQRKYFWFSVDKK